MLPFLLPVKAAKEEGTTTRNQTTDAEKQVLKQQQVENKTTVPVKVVTRAQASKRDAKDQNDEKTKSEKADKPSIGTSSKENPWKARRAQMKARRERKQKAVEAELEAADQAAKGS